MSSKLFTYAAAAVVAGASFGVANVANAGSITFEDAGWRASWDSSFDDASGTFVTLTELGTTSTQLVLQKVAAFTRGPDKYGLIAPVEINFEQLRADAVPYIVIDREIVTNASGTDWNGFRFIIEGGTTGTDADPRFDIDKSFGGANPFDITPFKDWQASGITINAQTVTVTDGTVSDTAIWRPGFAEGGRGGDLVIAAAPSANGTTRFVFKEQPLPIPLPAAAWTGLSSLAGLALFGGYKRLRRQVG